MRLARVEPVVVDIAVQHRANALRVLPAVPVKVRHQLFRRQTVQVWIGGDAIPELGYSFSCWSGHEDGRLSYSLSICCGATSQHSPNCVVLGLPREGSLCLSALGKLRLRQLLREAAAIWDADTGSIHSSLLDEDRKWRRAALLRYENGEIEDHWDEGSPSVTRW